MAILAEYPICHSKQATKNKACKCGQTPGQGEKIQEGWFLMAGMTFLRFSDDYYMLGFKIRS